ncbi:hypothetical protein LNKW23_29030 [Paralimibaculum aggregatum]|uniref:Uncharacterized protein n=1 Tax=Paralimibaculum aggregatum TaxID=3036245 RepID=A0ABQ6LN24_9RHOB|nr:hypothetical protein LNKW23_29030 [Limibaculum sp. NKW23]
MAAAGAIAGTVVARCPEGEAGRGAMGAVRPARGEIGRPERKGRPARSGPQPVLRGRDPRRSDLCDHSAAISASLAGATAQAENLNSGILP